MDFPTGLGVFQANFDPSVCRLKSKFNSESVSISKYSGIANDMAAKIPLSAIHLVLGV